MYLLYCDETNLEEKAGDFFAYGGISVPGDTALGLTSAMDDIRKKLGVAKDYRLKFNPGPGNLTHEQFIHLKQQVMQADLPRFFDPIVT